MPGFDSTAEIAHLRQALHRADSEEARYHIREALQLLYAHQGTTRAGRA